ncbi:MAG TPA: LPS export ABC transporter periplasmic protein LptC [Fibrobacter sp.]|nr:LPS export ABC transporter periplasmic protein LptC [Fibrobacter sp.]
MARFLHKSSLLLQSLGILGLGILLLFPFLGCQEIEEEAPWESVDRPLMLFRDTTLLDFYEEEVLSWKLKTAYLERWASDDKIFARPIFVDIFDSLGQKVAFLRADSGTLDMAMNYIFAYGHVFAFTPKGASVRSDSLLWHKKDNLVKTESYVRVVTEDGDVLQGKGFVSDAKMDNWKIQSQVTGIFQDAAKRLKKEDEAIVNEKISTKPTPKNKNDSVRAATRPLTDREARRQDRRNKSRLEGTDPKRNAENELEKERRRQERSNRPRARRRDE